jgi:type II secretory pathway pseudopilin PulG
MKFSSFNQIGSRRTAACAFTLAEMLIAIGIFSMVIGAMVATQLFGLRIYTLAATKLSATAGCRMALNQVQNQIREAKLVNVGSCSGNYTTFSQLGLSNNQVGNAVMVFPPAIWNTNGWDTNNYILFYLDTTTSTNFLTEYAHTIVATITATATNLITNTPATTQLAGYITNLDVFAAEDYTGNILTNEEQLDAIDNRLVIYMKMQFYQWEYPIAVVGTNTGFGNMYDFYQLRTKITRRAWN